MGTKTRKQRSRSVSRRGRRTRPRSRQGRRPRTRQGRRQHGGGKHTPGGVLYTASSTLGEFFPKNFNPIPHFIPKNNLWEPVQGGTHYSLSPDFHALNTDITIGGDSTDIQTIPQMYAKLDTIEVPDVPTQTGGGLTSLLPSQLISTGRTLEHGSRAIMAGINGRPLSSSHNPSVLHQPNLQHETSFNINPIDINNHIENSRNIVSQL